MAASFLTQTSAELNLEKSFAAVNNRTSRLTVRTAVIAAARLVVCEEDGIDNDRLLRAALSQQAIIINQVVCDSPRQIQFGLKVPF